MVYGGKDEFSPPHHGRWLAENIPNAIPVYLPNATHRVVMQEGQRIGLDWMLEDHIVERENKKSSKFELFYICNNTLAER